MSYFTISSWTTTDWTNDMEDLARDKYVPLVKAVGATSVHIVRTGELSFSVVTQYSDQASGEAAQAKIAEIRANAKDELPMTMIDVVAGSSFAEG